MKFDKKFQKLVDKTLQEQYDNEKFLNDLKSKQAENTASEKFSKTKKRFSKRFIGMLTSCCIIVIVGIVLSCTFLIDRENPPKGYLHGDELQIQSDKESFNDASKGLALIDGAWYVTRCIDSLTQDELYYTAFCNFEDIIDGLQIKLITNPNYEYFWEVYPNKAGHVKGYEIDYREKIEFDENAGLFRFICRGIINIGKQRIYIDYDGYAETESNPFLLFLDNVLELKTN